jgi:hypothetical protein
MASRGDEAMARYKEYYYEQAKLIPISFSQQIVPGSFEYTLNYLIDQEFDLWVFAARYRNDATTSSSSRSPQIRHPISRRLPILSPRSARRSRVSFAMCC